MSNSSSSSSLDEGAETLQNIRRLKLPTRPPPLLLPSNVPPQEEPSDEQPARIVVPLPPAPVPAPENKTDLVASPKSTADVPPLSSVEEMTENIKNAELSAPEISPLPPQALVASPIVEHTPPPLATSTSSSASENRSHSPPECPQDALPHPIAADLPSAPLDSAVSQQPPSPQVEAPIVSSEPQPPVDPGPSPAQQAACDFFLNPADPSCVTKVLTNEVAGPLPPPRVAPPVPPHGSSSLPPLPVKGKQKKKHQQQQQQQQQQQRIQEESQKPPALEVQDVKRQRNEWEHRTGVAMFQSTSDEDTFSLPSPLQKNPEVYGSRRSAANAAKKENSSRRKHKKNNNKLIYNTHETTSSSYYTGSSSSRSQAGVSLSSSNGTPGLPLVDSSLSSSSHKGRRRYTVVRRRGAATDNVDVVVEDDEFGVVVTAENIETPHSPETDRMEREAADDKEKAYVATLRGPLDGLEEMYKDGGTTPMFLDFTWKREWSLIPTIDDVVTPDAGSNSRVERPFSLPSPTAPNRVLSITVRGMSPLHADTGVVHPFVRIWLLNSATGENLVLSERAVPCAMSQPFDLRSRRTRSPWWEAEVAIRLDAAAVKRATTEAALFFEVLDCGNETIHGYYLPREGLYPICWGYLMLNDCYGTPERQLENVHVQLFPFPMRTSWYMRAVQAMLPSAWSHASAEAVSNQLTLTGNPSPSPPPQQGGTADAQPPRARQLPMVFQVFQNPDNRKVPYCGGLIVSLKSPENRLYIPETTPMFPYEEYLLNLLVSGGGSCSVPRRAADTCDIRRPTFGLDTTHRSLLRRTTILNIPALTDSYERSKDERVLPPVTAIQTAAVEGKVTCMSFADEVPILAVGVTRHLQFYVEIRNAMLPELPTLALLTGHTGHIHNVSFKNGDKYILSASSDRTVRVWRLSHNELNMDDTSSRYDVRLVVTHLCTLPHAFPVYSAIFHHESMIITGGYDTQLYSWRFDKPLQVGVNDSMASAESPESSWLHLTDFTNAHSGNAHGSPASQRRAIVGELLHKTSAEGDGMVLSLASNGTGNRVWSVSSGGTVNCWRALFEHRREGESVWQITVRHRSDCAGATEVHVQGEHAMVCGAKSPAVYIFDATTCEQVRVIRTSLGPNTPMTLLPDGEAFVAGTTEGNLIAWDCTDGALCTPASGYNKVKTNFVIEGIAWAGSQQLAALRSPAPCPESCLPNYGVSQLTGQPDVSTELTLIAVVGSSSSEATALLRSSKSASEDFCRLFGGDVALKKKAATQAARNKAVEQKRSDRDTRGKRLYDQKPVIAAKSAADTAMSATMSGTSNDLDYTEKGMRFNYLVNFWKGLVQQHRHDHSPDTDAAPLTQRVSNYASNDSDSV